MEILLIGNGFDLEHKLPTAYQDFLLFCAKIKPIFSTSYTYETYKNNFLNEWEIHENVKQILLEAFSTRHKDESIITDSEYDSGIRTKNSQLNELYSYIKFNTWLRYFQECHHRLGKDWIDFESEISKVIRSLDSAKKYLSSNRNILETKLNNDAILIEIVKAANSSLQTAFRNTAAVESFVSFLNTELEKLIRALEIYISYFVNQMDGIQSSPDIQQLNPDHILSFNYSNTYERIYGKKNDVKYAYIHGKADFNKNVSSCNMVLGIDEYLDDDRKKSELEFLTFKKYYQRIYKSTDNEYLEWVDEIKEGYAQYVQKIENERKNSIRKGDSSVHPLVIKRLDRMYTEGAYICCPQHTLYIFGHSLNITDQDVLKMFICNDNVQTKIYYYRENEDDKKTLGKIIRNLIQVMGPDELIRRTGGAHKTIEFIPQTIHS